MCVCVQGCLFKLREDISKTLEKVSSREKYLNTQLEHLISEYRQAQAQLNKVNCSTNQNPQMYYFYILLYYVTTIQNAEWLNTCYPQPIKTQDNQSHVFLFIR